MEAQADRHSSLDDSPVAVVSTQSTSDASPSASVLTLRFPKPQGNQKLANWISSSSSDIMASTPSRDDDNHLSESTFEFVPLYSNDEGSQDERADSLSGSISEYERYPNPDEVQCFAGLDDMSTSAASTLASDSDEEDAPRSEASFFQDGPADDILRNPLERGSIPQPFASTSSPTLPSSIEFREPEDVDVHIDKISVKHTIKEFSLEESYQIIRSLNLGEFPKSLCATIRQTMSQECLSTHEAFRVLYVGDEALKGEIILKISRAITCSSSVDYNENKTLRRNTEGVYNIVPVTFGPIKDRDVELMEASGFQIKVDTCIDAEKIPIEGGFFRDDIVYSLTVDGGNGGKKYKSVPAGGPEGARVQPAWTLPHVAVVYCSEDDDEDVQRIQRITWEFCNRHAIPCLYISDHPAFASPIAGSWRNYTNEHAVHLSLESRDFKNREAPDWPEQRFPIDLSSFLNIDNRQMNQNLAYLTGLQEPPSVAEEKMKEVISLAGSEQDLPDKEPKEWKLYFEDIMDSYLQVIEDNRYFSLLYPLALVLSMMVFFCLVNVKPSAVPSPSVVSMPDVPSITLSSVTTTTTATVTHDITSTKTVRIAAADTPTFGGLLSDIDHTVSSEVAKSTLCSVSMYSGNEILIKLPSGTKTSWLARGAIEVDVFRGSAPVKSRLSSIDEGILIEINQKDAHGVLNVSVVTTRKPKINETFAVDFGTSLFYGAFEAAKDAFQNMAQKVGGFVDETFKVVEENCASVLASAEEKYKDQAASWWDLIKDASKAAHGYSSQKAGQTYERVKDSIHRREDATALLKDVQKTIHDQLRLAEDVRDEASLAILKAQITSKLWWLKIRGKTQEYEEYERLARNFMTKRHELHKAKRVWKTTGKTSSEPTKCPLSTHKYGKSLRRFKV